MKGKKAPKNNVTVTPTALHEGGDMKVEVIETPESSNVKRCEYNHNSHTLTIHFKSGSYEYSREPGVPLDVWEALKASESKGKFINLMIVPAINGYVVRKLA